MQIDRPREVAPVVRAVAEVVEGPGKVALVGQLAPDGRRRFVARDGGVIVAVVLGQQSRCP